MAGFEVTAEADEPDCKAIRASVMGFCSGFADEG
jgi:hypothetical protein